MDDIRKSSLPDAGTKSTAPDSRQPRLIRLLYRKAEDRGHTRHELARALGITYGELMTYAAGSRDMVGTKRPTVRTISQYLELPPVAVWLLAGKLQTADFLIPRNSAQAPERMLTTQCLQDDPILGPIVPPDLFDAPSNAKALLGSLYEDAKSRGLFPAGKLPTLLTGVQRAVEKMEDADYQADAEHLARGRLQ